MTTKWNGIWGILDLDTKQYTKSFPTKDEAMKSIELVNAQEEAIRGYKKYGVVPLTFARLNELSTQTDV